MDNHKISVELNQESYSYNIKSYKFEYLNKIIDKQDWEHIIKEASKVMGQCWIDKKLNEKINLPRYMIILAIISVILVVVYITTFFASANSENESSVLLIISIISFSISTILSGILATHNFIRKIKYFPSLEEMMQKNMDKYLKRVNHIYDGILEFSYLEHCKSIQCSILEKKTLSTLENFYEGKILITENNLEVSLDKKQLNGG